MGRKRAKSGVRTTARNFSGILNSANANRNQGFMMDGSTPLNISSNPQMIAQSQTPAEKSNFA